MHKLIYCRSGTISIVCDYKCRTETEKEKLSDADVQSNEMTEGKGLSLH